MTGEKSHRSFLLMIGVDVLPRPFRANEFFFSPPTSQPRIVRSRNTVGQINHLRHRWLSIKIATTLASPSKRRKVVVSGIRRSIDTSRKKNRSFRVCANFFWMYSYSMEIPDEFSIASFFLSFLHLPTSWLSSEYFTVQFLWNTSRYNCLLSLHKGDANLLCITSILVQNNKKLGYKVLYL